MDEPTEEQLIEQMQDMQEEQADDSQLDQLENSFDFQQSYGAPEPEERQNQHSFLHKAAFGTQDTVKTTFLSPEELGRPMFNVRFLMDLCDISNHYINPILVRLGLDPKTDNRIANYFGEKTQNITASGMSREGFAMNLNVTRKMDTVRKKVKDNIQNLQGGKKRK